MTNPNLNSRQFKTQMMAVADLLPHAADRQYDEHSSRYVNTLADSMRSYGYHPTPGANTRGGKFMKRKGYFALEDKPVTLNHDAHGSYIEPGNHRVAAAHLAGIETIPVRVRHFE